MIGTKRKAKRKATTKRRTRKVRRPRCRAWPAPLLPTEDLTLGEYPDSRWHRAPPYWQHERGWRARYLLDACRALSWLLKDHSFRTWWAAERERQRADDARAFQEAARRIEQDKRERWRTGGFKLFDSHARSLEAVRHEREGRIGAMAAYIPPPILWRG